MKPGTVLLALVATSATFAQDRLPQMPRYDRYEKLRREISGSIESGRINVQWNRADKSMFYRFGGKNYQFFLERAQLTEVDSIPAPQAGGGGTRGRNQPERGRQFDRVTSADGKLVAFHKDRAVWLSDADGKNERMISPVGSLEKRTKFGVASWVYGEELGVREAMWFSPDGKYLAYYGFDESKVKDFYLTMGLTQFQSVLDVEAYPKAGTDNPEVQLFILDLASNKTIEVDAKFGEAELGHYVYEVRWAPKGSELLYHRTNRKQNKMQLVAVNPADGKSKTIYEEAWAASWVENSPPVWWLETGRQFITTTERNGFKNLIMHDLDGKPEVVITKHKFDVGSVMRIDDDERAVYYTARSGNNPYLNQLHRIRWDGQYDLRLTDPAFHHSVQVSPFEHWFIDVMENATTPPKTVLREQTGRQMIEMGDSKLDKFKALKLNAPERFKFMAADGKTECWGWLHKPSDFDPKKKYPLIVEVYGGPESGGGWETFRTPDATTELGFLVAEIDGRGTNGRGKAFKDAVYGKLGIVEIDDQAAGVKALAKRPYVDGKRVGIAGTSYGGYASAMALLRYPDVFHAAVAQSSVTDWRHYDTIYTERYMGLPTAEDNLKGYDEGSAMKYAKDLKGRLMLFFGSADNNVHPNNSLMLAQALNRAGKSYQMMVGPDQGHTGIGFARQWEYFIEHLILVPGKQGAMLADRLTQRRAETGR